MQARDVMVSPVVTVGKSAIVRDVAKLLLEKRISAVPVVDDAGKVVGIVTEGDLIHRAEAGTERHDSWWLRFLTDNATFAADYVKSHAMKVEDVMTSSKSGEERKAIRVVAEAIPGVTVVNDHLTVSTLI